MSVLILSSVISVGLVIILDLTSTPRATYIRFGRCIDLLDIFDIIMTDGFPRITSMIPCAKIATVVLIRRGCEVILINPVPLVFTCTGVSEIGGRIFCCNTLIGKHWSTHHLFRRILP